MCPATVFLTFLSNVMPTCLLLMLTVIHFVPSTSGDAIDDFNWGYQPNNGPAQWPGICQTGQRQSPINISQSMIEPLDCDELSFINYGTNGSVQLYNSGRSLVVIGFDSWTPQPTVSGGGLNGMYNLVQLHFVWSDTDQSSANHVVGSQPTPLELQLVHVRQGLNITEAAELPDGVAVISVPFYVNESVQSPLLLLQNAINATRGPNGHMLLDVLVPARLFPPVQNSFYRYNGSLTTYPCTEMVVWTLLSQPLPVTHNLIELFRQFQDSQGNQLLFNDRPAQPLNDRQVLLRQPQNSAHSIISKNFIFSAYLLLLMWWSKC